MLHITASDLKSNLGKYLAMAIKEDIIITKNGTEIAVLTKPKPKPSLVDELIGIIPHCDSENIDAKTIRKERLQRYESHN